MTASIFDKPSSIFTSPLRIGDRGKTISASVVVDLLDQLAVDLASADLLVGDHYDPELRLYEPATPAVVQRNALENLAGIRDEFDQRVMFS